MNMNFLQLAFFELLVFFFSKPGPICCLFYKYIQFSLCFPNCKDLTVGTGAKEENHEPLFEQTYSW